MILDYLARETGHISKASPNRSAWRAREWLSWEADHITAVARVRHSARFRKMHDEVIAEFRPRAEAALSFVNNRLKESEWLVGDHFTIADIGCWGRMVFMHEGGFEIFEELARSRSEAWANRIKSNCAGVCALPYDPDPEQGPRVRPGLATSEARPPRNLPAPESPPPLKRGVGGKRKALSRHRGEGSTQFCHCELQQENLRSLRNDVALRRSVDRSNDRAQGEKPIGARSGALKPCRAVLFDDSAVERQSRPDFVDHRQLDDAVSGLLAGVHARPEQALGDRVFDEALDRPF